MLRLRRDVLGQVPAYLGRDARRQGRERARERRRYGGRERLRVPDADRRGPQPRRTGYRDAPSGRSARVKIETYPAKHLRSADRVAHERPLQRNTFLTGFLPVGPFVNGPSSTKCAALGAIPVLLREHVGELLQALVQLTHLVGDSGAVVSRAAAVARARLLALLELGDLAAQMRKLLGHPGELRELLGKSLHALLD